VDSAPTNPAYQATEQVVAGFSRGVAGALAFSTINVDVKGIKLYDANATSVNTPATSGQVFGTTSLTGTAGFTGGTANFGGTNEVKFDLTLGDGSTATITLNNTTLSSAVANLAAVTTTEFLDAINNQIAADTAVTPLAGKVRASLDTSGRLTFQTTATGAGTNAQIAIQNVAPTATYTLIDVGFGTGTAPTDTRIGSGSAAGTTAGRGILDTIDGLTSFAVSTIDISGLAGTAGDTALKAIITQVDRALAKVTDAGTKLGANKTQIDGQMSFVDTLMKANDRTVGTLVDADIEEESTKLKALQTQQQLAIQALSIANSSGESILTLFR
ncbi:flagellin, partial [Methylobacterium isbiliense]